MVVNFTICSVNNHDKNVKTTNRMVILTNQLGFFSVRLRWLTFWMF